MKKFRSYSIAAIVTVLTLVLMLCIPIFAFGNTITVGSAPDDVISGHEYAKMLKSFDHIDFGGGKTQYPDYYGGA